MTAAAVRCADTRGRTPGPAVFIDKDGTLVENLPFNVDPARVRYSPFAFEALRLLAAAGYRPVIVSNQSGVAEGRFTAAALAQLARGMTVQLARAGIALLDFQACPHARGAGCACRKPAPGLLREAARVHGIDLARSWMIGDILDDVEAGHRAGCRSVLLDVGNETEWLPGPGRDPDRRCTDLLSAARAILSAGPAVAPGGAAHAGAIATSTANSTATATANAAGAASNAQATPARAAATVRRVAPLPGPWR